MDECYGLFFYKSEPVDPSTFSFDMELEHRVKFDDSNKKMAVFVPSHGYNVYDYEDIIDFEVKENTEGKGNASIGRAFAGGVLFGGAGAVVGSLTGNRSGKCSDLRINVTVKDQDNPMVCIRFIYFETKRNSNEYAVKVHLVEKCVAKLKLIYEESNCEQEQTTTFSPADEILKFKNLLDIGAITQEEFDTEKKKLLSM